MSTGVLSANSHVARGLARQILVLALLDVFLGWLGLKLAMPPGYVTAVFPPAGIALAALLRQGPRVWPGIFLGSIALNTLVGAVSLSGLTLTSAALSVTIAAGSTLQALAGYWLIKRWVPDAEQLRDGRKLVLMLLLGGPLACLIAGSIGSTALVVLGKGNWTNWPFSLWSWWVGDTIGVILCTPTFLVLSQMNRASWRRPVVSVVLPSLTMLALVVQLFFQSNSWERQRLDAAFMAEARTVAYDLRRELEGDQDTVYALAQHFRAEGEVSAADFTTFSHNLIGRHTGILALEFVDEVPADQRNAYERQVAALGMPGFRIGEFDPHGAFTPATRRGEYYPVRYIEPLDPYRWLVGYDMASEPTRRTAFQQARDTHQVAVAVIDLVSVHQKGLLILEPVYRGEHNDMKAPPHFVGTAMAVFRLDTLIAHAMPEAAGKDIVVQIDDTTASQQIDHLYSGKGTASALYPDLFWSDSVNIGSHRWTLAMRASDDFVSRQASYVAWLVLAGGLLFTGILQMLLLSLTSHALNIEDEVAKRTHELAESERRLSVTLEEKETLLKEVYHRVKNNLQVITSLLSLEGDGLEAGPARDALENTESRVRAMSLVHEKLYQSKNLSSVNLADYTNELVDHLLYSGASDSRNIRVEKTIADVHVGLDAAVPLGLLLNELISNAIKHAFPDGRDGVLRIEICQQAQGLHLTVSDNGIGLRSDFDPLTLPSMGIKLAVGLARQLGGALTMSTSGGAVFMTNIRLES